MSAIIEQGMQAGQMKQIEPYVAVLTILSAIRGIESWHRSRKIITEEVLEENMVKFLVEGLK